MAFHQPPTLGEPDALTLTQVLRQDSRLCLYGRSVADLSPRGDLGLGLDPEGPVGFALVRAYRHRGRFSLLPAPLVLSVYGRGQSPDPADGDAQAGERLWPAATADRALHLGLSYGSLGALLGACNR